MSHSSTVAQPPPPVPEAMEIEGVWIVRTSKRSPIRILGLNNSLGILGQSHVPNPTRMRRSPEQRPLQLGNFVSSKPIHIFH